MVKNQKQATITKVKLAELINAKSKFEDRGLEKDSPEYLLGMASFNSLIEDLGKEIQEYEGLVNGNFHFLQAKELSEIPKVLISARLAQRMSQKDLGEQVGLKEQQIQRYEAADYETASWPRIVEIAMALNLSLKFEKNMIINSSQAVDFTYSENITVEQVETASRIVKQRRSLTLS